MLDRIDKFDEKLQYASLKIARQATKIVCHDYAPGLSDEHRDELFERLCGMTLRKLRLWVEL
jgi:hypothetical protein